MDANGEFCGSNNDCSQGGGYYGTSSYKSLITSKDEWAGISPERAYSENVPWSFKRQAQIKYLAMLKENRHALINHTAYEMTADGKWRAEPQISAFYSGFPWPARASVGHTAFTEASYLKQSIVEEIRIYLCNGEKAKACQLDIRAYLVAAFVTAESLGNRVMFDELGVHTDLVNVEFYRLFQAAHNTLRFPQLSDVINGVVLLGDILPEPRFLNLHPLTEKIMTSLIDASQQWWKKIEKQSSSPDNLGVYLKWGDTIMRALEEYLPQRRNEKSDKEKQQQDSKPEQENQECEQEHLTTGRKQPEIQDHIPPLSIPQPPRLDEIHSPFNDSFSDIENLFDDPNEFDDLEPPPLYKQEEAQPSSAQQALDEMMNIAIKATSQGSDWEDMREDLVEQSLMDRPFQKGPVEGEVTNGTSITREIGGKEVGGELYDRNVPLCENVEQIEALRQQAAPLSEALKRNLYPSLNETFKIEYPLASGQLSGNRLPLVAFSDSVYRRFLVETELDPSGRAVLLIAADASASLSDEQMQMCKCLMAG
ncbi:MAG: hypothetical protein KAH12_07340, partial [Anaerolineales bacterium]|nr:hypothetical protein [Anaerolineales bacterium]